MRLLEAERADAELQLAGIPAGDRRALNQILDMPQGMLLVTGPTGSGKSTTLYASLNQVRKPSLNIITVEDPVEYAVPGLNQVQVNTKAGLTFASCLRSILRQDPNVIMIGEIRDKETAKSPSKPRKPGTWCFPLSIRTTASRPSPASRPGRARISDRDIRDRNHRATTGAASVLVPRRNSRNA